MNLSNEVIQNTISDLTTQVKDVAGSIFPELFYCATILFLIFLFIGFFFTTTKLLHKRDLYLEERRKRFARMSAEAGHIHKKIKYMKNKLGIL